MPTKYQKARLWTTDASGARVSDEVEPKDITDRPDRADLTCVGCPVPLSWVTPGVTRAGDDRGAFLRLYPKGEHAPDCRLNFKTMMQGERAKKDLDIDLREKKFFIKLPGESTRSVPQRTSSSTQKRSNAPSWATTFGGVKRIRRFLEQFADADEFMNQMRVEYRNADDGVDVVFWRDFCFDISDEAALAKYYGRVRYLGRSVAEKIAPAAITMTITEGTTPTSSWDLQRVRARADFTVKNNAGSDVDLVIAVYSTDKVNGLVPGDRIMVLGHATTWEWSNGKTAEIRFDVEHSWQIEKY